jgi:hypothetical protein
MDIWVRCVLLSVLLCSCGAPPKKREPRYHSPLVSSVWGPPAPRRSAKPAHRPDSDAKTETGDGGMATAVPPDIREQMAAEAMSLVNSEGESGDYGTGDLGIVMGKVVKQVEWRADRGLKALVDLAGKKSAYYTDGRPLLGDVVLFHNQMDANGNGETDDWLTGCGVVIDSRGDRFDVVLRTGHHPRRISAWPSGPKRRVVDGEIVNSYLRIPHRSDRPDVQYLAGALYAGHIDIEELAAGGK